MDIILKEIVAIIKEETENINKKIYGTTFLEILKEKILNRQDQISLKNLVIQNSNCIISEFFGKFKLHTVPFDNVTPIKGFKLRLIYF